MNSCACPKKNEPREEIIEKLKKKDDISDQNDFGEFGKNLYAFFFFFFNIRYKKTHEIF